MGAWGGVSGWTFSDTKHELNEYLLASFIYSINCPFSQEMAYIYLKNLDEVRASLSNALFGW